MNIVLHIHFEIDKFIIINTYNKKFIIRIRKNNIIIDYNEN